jgi:hypothetical protein
MLAIVSILAAVLITSCDSVFPPLSPEQVEQTKKICRELSIPQSFKKIRDRAIEKSNAVTYTTEFYSDENSKNVEDT